MSVTTGTAGAPTAPAVTVQPQSWWSAIQSRQPALARAAFVFLVLGLVALVAGLVDPRTHNGVDIWAKPAKFFISAAAYLATLAWFFPLLGRYRHGRSGRLLVRVSIAGMAIELIIIAGQAGRGVASHFNEATPFDSALYTIMGVAIVLTTLGLPLMAWLIARAGSIDVAPSWRWAVIIGLVAGWLGGLEGMAIAENGSHWVGGTPSDAGGIPPFFWSRDGGDLRVAHFFGLHAMQVIPFLGFVAGRLLPRRLALPGMLAMAAAYCVFAAWTFTAALDGRPFI